MFTRAKRFALSTVIGAVMLALAALPAGATDLTPRWPGHVPGKFLLGMSCGSVCDTREAQLNGHPYGVHRLFRHWGEWSKITSQINEEHAAGRVPWISVQGYSSGSVSGWKAVANGSRDADIKALASALKAASAGPVILTFHHEPSNDGAEAEGVYWANAFSRVYDVLRAQGALDRVAYTPILGDWLFNPSNSKQDPANWVKPNVLVRSSFFGVDLYENPSGVTAGPRLQRILDWLAAHGASSLMVGVGELGGTDAAYPKKTAVQFIDESLSWAKANTDKIGVISYFNSEANSRTGVYWPLDESKAKTDLFLRWLDDPSVATHF